MWFNIIPPFAIVVGAIALPAYATYWMHYLFIGNHFRRSLNQRWERHLYTRDVRLTGSPYIMQGLELLPTYTEEELDKMAEVREREREKRKIELEKKKAKKLEEKIIRLFSEDDDEEIKS